MQKFEVTEAEQNGRLDSFLVKHFSSFSRVKLQRAISAGQVLIDGQKAKASSRLKVNQVVSVEPLKQESETPIPEQIDLDILYEDDHLVAINKPPGMVVHPAKGHWSGTLTSALAWHFDSLSTVGGPTRPGIVHRLDRDTSGVILVAKTDSAHMNLSKQFENRTVSKEYFAIVTPPPDRDRGIIEKPIGAHPYQREKKAIREGHSTSRNATTFYEVRERFLGFATVLVKPKTGRTHQIRVHLAHVGSAVLCDALYSGRSKLSLKDIVPRATADEILLDRQALHASRIQVTHPETGETLVVTAPLSNDIEKALDTIRQQRALGKSQ